MASNTTDAQDKDQTERRSSDRRTFSRIAPSADFVSQIIAEHQHLGWHETPVGAPADSAVTAYENGAKRAVRRMPAGYRTTVIV
jgi:hypothetical protein